MDNGLAGWRLTESLTRPASERRFVIRHLSSLILLVFVLCVAACDGSEPLRFDEQGEAHGTGERVYLYESSEVMLREQYVDGRLELSKWYAPDGTLVEETDWIDESGIGVYLRQNGSIQVRMTYVNGLAEGTATYYDEEGNVTKEVEFRDGQPVGE